MNKTKELELRKLLVAAFADAKAKGKPDWQNMHLGVLKNRLLQRTKRQFREVNYGAKTMRDIVERFPDLFALQDGHPPLLSFLGETPDKELAEPEGDPDWGDGPDLDEAADRTAGFQVILDRYRMNSDNLGVGEAYASHLSSVDEADVERAFANIVSRWASSSPVDMEVNNIRDILENIDKFVNDLLARAVVHATLCMERAGRALPASVSDLNYRVSESLRLLFHIQGRMRPAEIMRTATVKTKELQSALVEAVRGFCRSTAVAAKLPSTNIIKLAHSYAPYALGGEQQTLRDVEMLLGALFRKFCESCENHEAERIPRRAWDLRHQLQRILDSLAGELDHRLRALVLDPVASHMSRLIEEGTRTSEEMMMPSIKIIGGTFKLNLARYGDDVLFPASVINDGDGTAHSVRVKTVKSVGSPVLSASEPSDPFDLFPHTERLIRLKLSEVQRDGPVKLEAVFECQTINGSPLTFKQQLVFKQQGTQPDWDYLLRNPPYAINPIREKRNLYGRDSVLADLEHHVSNETSTFLWGQKRIGKTSVLQVLAGNLDDREDIVCIILRMGELVSLHEGQLAHIVAVRLVDALDVEYEVPGEDKFRAGLGRLVPLVEELAHMSRKKMLVIIDEFDDLNPAFYLGERGKQFVKALRSLSEVGLTFMFVGSERMNSIYSTHSSDLNKWVNSSLDRIEVQADCEALITEPVAGKIEYDQEAVKSIVEYCLGNPFYMHLVAGKVFRRCAQEQRTFVGSSDFEYVHQNLGRELGPTNFAHFWEDVPVLDPEEKLRAIADNCLFLVCVAMIGSGGYESLDDLTEAQKQLPMSVQEQMSLPDLQRIENGLLQRQVIFRKRRGEVPHITEVKLPVFRDWLLESGERQLISAWQSFREDLKARSAVEDTKLSVIVERSVFPIDEDELLSVSGRLVYLGRQKDVAEIRQWLRQFDDDGRIEVAFLLLKRLVDQGFINEGENVNELAKMEEAILARRRDIGDGVWRMVRRRRDNLYLCHVDSETKSGAATARELAKRMSPGKCSGIEGVPTWLHGHLTDDPMLVVVDDFAGTGNTLAKGLDKIRSLDEPQFSRVAKEGRVLCCLQTAFPEAVRHIKERFPEVLVLVMKTFDDKVRGLEPDANIFEDEGERAFAEEVMLQIGRQLAPQNPLGYGDMAALVSFHNTVPNNTLPVFWCAGRANRREWKPLLPRGTFVS